MPHTSLFKNKVPVEKKLALSGFSKQGDSWLYRTEVSDGQFVLDVSVSSDGSVATKLTDVDTAEEYVLHRVPEASGAFVERVRREYLEILGEISEKCFERKVFKSRLAERAVGHIRERYGREFEFLWEKFPDAAAVRRPDNRKWFAVLLGVDQRKIGLSGEGATEIIDLRAGAAEIPLLIDGKRYFPAYHMNKKSWITVLLESDIPETELFSMIDKSYALADKKKSE